MGYGSVAVVGWEIPAISGFIAFSVHSDDTLMPARVLFGI
jgi:hypothetical protein